MDLIVRCCLRIRSKDRCNFQIIECVIRFLHSPIPSQGGRRIIRQYLHGNARDQLIYKYGYMEYWDVSQVYDMTDFFLHEWTFNVNISRWEVSQVICMQDMFRGSFQFNQDISNWDVSNVENMDGMFCGARRFNQSLVSWNVKKVTSWRNFFLKNREVNPDHLPLFA